MDKLHGTWKNRILCIAVLVFVFIMAAQAMHNGMFTALALEQPARCGMEEHIHTEECYIDHVLICQKKAHTHSENCYLLLLGDNDINWLLSVVDSTADNNLNSVIESAVFQALTSDSTDEEIATDFAETLQTSLTVASIAAQTTAVTTTGFFFTDIAETTVYETTAPVATLYALENTTISTLNTTITENNIQPAVVLNENLVSTMALTDDDDVAVAAEIVDSSPSTANNAANFYVYFVDENGIGSWEFIGTETYESVFILGNWGSYYAITTSTVLDLMEGSLGIEVSSVPTTYYATSTTGTRTKTGTGTDWYGQSYITFGTASNSVGTYYVYIGAGGAGVNAEPSVKYCRVTYDYSEYTGTQEIGPGYLEIGETITLPTLVTGYRWQDQDENTYDSGTTITVDKSYTFKPFLSGYTVTYQYANGTVIDTVEKVSGTHTLQDPPTDYIWVDENGDEITDKSITVIGNRTITAVPSTYTVTYQDGNGDKIHQDTFNYKDRVTLYTSLPEGYTLWKDVSTAVYYEAGDNTLTATRNYTFQAVYTYAVTCLDNSGNVLSSDAVDPGGTYTLAAPDGNYVWVDQDGNSYSRETTFTVNKNLTFTQKPYLTITYTVGYSESGADNVGISGETVPTVMGSSSHTHTLVQGTIETIYPVSETPVTSSPMPRTDNARPGIAVFKGWQIGDTDTVWQPGESYSYSDLLQYADDSGVVTLTGSWEYSRGKAVNFFIEYDSEFDASENSEDFTKVLFVTYYGGTAPYSISSGTAVEKDEAIRNLYENGTDAAYFASFPTDDYIFEALKAYAGDSGALEVDGEKVQVADLNENGYTIRWYNLNYVSSDGNYHIDGALVRKAGYLDITKTFSGNKDAIADVKDSGDYSIRATNGTTTHTLTLESGSYASYDEATDTYTWRIENVKYGEQWTIAEHNYGSPYAEYTVTDALGTQSASGEYPEGGVTVAGQTYADTVGANEVLTVGLTNIYPGTDSFILKKEDADTAQPLSGAEFELLQSGEKLRFTYDAEHGIYTCDPDGDVTALTGNGGFVEITVTGLDFTIGDITVVESKVPEGYAPTGSNVTLTMNDARVITIVEDTDDAGTVTAKMVNGVLIIGNSSKTTFVKAEKRWDVAADARNVKLQLLANGELVSKLFPSVTAEVTLTSTEDAPIASYTWEDLPAYASGTKIVWTVKEIVIGDERVGSDGNFANWSVDYAPAETIEDDGNEGTLLVVTNVKKAGNTLVVYKTDETGNRLTGASFKLQMLTSSGTVSADFAAQTGTSDSSGYIAFHDLPYGNYLLTETDAPAGYFSASEICFTLNSDQTITITDDGDGAATVPASSTLAMQVTNRAARPLPETGGGGTLLYTCGGLLLMAASLLLYKALRRREEFPDV